MQSHFSKAPLAVSALTLPGVALAHQISPIIGALALSPVLVFLLAIALRGVTRNWTVAVKYFGLVGVDNSDSEGRASASQGLDAYSLRYLGGAHREIGNI